MVKALGILNKQPNAFDTSKENVAMKFYNLGSTLMRKKQMCLAGKATVQLTNKEFKLLVSSSTISHLPSVSPYTEVQALTPVPVDSSVDQQTPKEEKYYFHGKFCH
jgi:hypothetical protein